MSAMDAAPFSGGCGSATTATCATHYPGVHLRSPPSNSKIQKACARWHQRVCGMWRSHLTFLRSRVARCDVAIVCGAASAVLRREASFAEWLRRLEWLSLAFLEGNEDATSFYRSFRISVIL